ncbi:hypothetical protein P3L10_005438 [Capsicum annuum]
MNISVFLRHSGVWVNEIDYVGYKSNGIMVSEHVSYEKLISTIKVEFEIDEARKKIEARYIVEAMSYNAVRRSVFGSLKHHVVGSTSYNAVRRIVFGSLKNHVVGVQKFKASCVWRLKLS